MALIPIYNSKGDPGAFLEFPYLFNRSGEWIGFITKKRDVYSVLGVYVGYLTDDPRIVRRTMTATLKPRVMPPPPPGKVYPPAIVPLAPMMSELLSSTIDVLLEEPHRLHPIDTGELKEDIN